MRIHSGPNFEGKTQWMWVMRKRGVKETPRHLDETSGRVGGNVSRGSEAVVATKWGLGFGCIKSEMAINHLHREVE